MAKLNPDELLNTQLQTELATRRDPIPVGEYEALISNPKIDTVKFEDKDGQEQERVVLNYQATLEDEDLKEQFGDYPNAFGSVFLDLDEDGRLLTGDNENVQLGKLMDACGLNDEGSSMADIDGHRIRVFIKHRKSKNDPDEVFDYIAKVSPLEDE